jgi:hypothetical protein
MLSGEHNQSKKLPIAEQLSNPRKKHLWQRRIQRQLSLVGVAGRQQPGTGRHRSEQNKLERRLTLAGQEKRSLEERRR